MDNDISTTSKTFNVDGLPSAIAPHFPLTFEAIIMYRYAMCKSFCLETFEIIIKEIGSIQPTATTTFKLVQYVLNSLGVLVYGWCDYDEPRCNAWILGHFLGDDDVTYSTFSYHVFTSTIYIHECFRRIGRFNT